MGRGALPAAPGVPAPAQPWPRGPVAPASQEGAGASDGTTSLLALLPAHSPAQGEAWGAWGGRSEILQVGEPWLWTPGSGSGSQAVPLPAPGTVITPLCSGSNPGIGPMALPSSSWVQVEAWGEAAAGQLPGQGLCRRCLRGGAGARSRPRRHEDVRLLLSESGGQSQPRAAL